MSLPLTRRQFLATAGVFGASAVLGGPGPSIASPGAVQKTYLPSIRNEIDGDRPNLITILCDTLRYDHIGCHGNSWIQTPNIDAFAAQAVVFDKAHTGGFPTLLNRAELFTGRWMYQCIGWGDLPACETPVASLLAGDGYLTGIVFDNWQLKDEGRTYDRGFGSWEWIRGQITDRYRLTPLEPPLPAQPSKFRNGASEIRQYLRNMGGRQSEADYLAAQTLHAAIAWLERTHDAGPFYLHIDCFDPHEPWDPPRRYVDLYDPGYSGEEVIYPAYAPPDYLSPAELHHMRALYAAEVTMVDHWLGELFAALDQLGLNQTTAVIFLSDHGFLLGEHDAVGKTLEDGGTRQAYALWEELAHIPLMIRLPGVDPRRTDALAQPADIAPTLLELAGIDRPASMHGASLVPLLRTQAGAQEPALRQVQVSARPLQTDLNMRPQVTVGDGEWTLIDGGGHAASSLYYLPSDPGQQVDRLAQEPGIARLLHAQLLAFLEASKVPEDRIAPWRPAPC